MTQAQSNLQFKAIWTRPQALQAGQAIKKNQDLANFIENGFMAHIPVIELHLARENPVLKQNKVWEQIEKCDILLLTSPSAINFLETQLKNEKHSLADMASQNIAFIGQKTHEEFSRLGGVTKQAIIPPTGKENSAELAAILNEKPQILFQQNQNLPYKILHPTSSKTSAKQWQAKLDPELFIYTQINLYENHIARQYQTAVQERLSHPTAWFFFSPSAVQAVAELARTQILRQPWQAWCIGSSTQKEAVAAGFTQVYVSSQAKAETLLTEFIHKYKMERN